MEHCANESALRVYLRTIGQEESRINAIEERTNSLLMTDCSDSKTDMVLEALAEVSEGVADCIAIHIASIGNKRCAGERAGHYEAIGRMVAGAVASYCETEAKRIAENEINDASCQHCFDAGCCKCGE